MKLRCCFVWVNALKLMTSKFKIRLSVGLFPLVQLVFVNQSVHLRRCLMIFLRALYFEVIKCAVAKLKIRSVSNWKFRFQSQKFCFKLNFFKELFAVKISENNQFCRSPGSNDKCRLHRKWCRRHFCFLLAAIIGGENIYRNVLCLGSVGR